jgi:hypothetical protein
MNAMENVPKSKYVISLGDSTMPIYAYRTDYLLDTSLYHYNVPVELRRIIMVYFGEKRGHADYAIYPFLITTLPESCVNEIEKRILKREIHFDDSVNLTTTLRYDFDRYVYHNEIETISKSSGRNIINFRRTPDNLESRLITIYPCLLLEFIKKYK